MEREEEPSIAKLRNKLSPIVNYFEMRNILDKQEMSIQQKMELHLLINEQYKYIQETNLNELLELVRDENIW